MIQRELMGKNPRWMRRQEEAYLKGMNLLCLSDQDFSTSEISESKQGFVQIRQSFEGFEKLLCNIIEKGIFLIDKLSTLPPFMLK